MTDNRLQPNRVVLTNAESDAKLNNFMMTLSMKQNDAVLRTTLLKAFNKQEMTPEEQAVFKSFDASFHGSIPQQFRPGVNQIITSMKSSMSIKPLYGGEVLIYNRDGKNYIHSFKVLSAVIQGGKQGGKQQARRSKSQGKSNKRSKSKSSEKQGKRSKSKGRR